jgi:hypothetical protein
MPTGIAIPGRQGSLAPQPLITIYSAAANCSATFRSSLGEPKAAPPLVRKLGGPAKV